MKSIRPYLLCLAALLFVSVAAAADKAKPAEPDLTLEDIIFDSSYLKKVLGAKTLIAPGAEEAKLSAEDIAKAGLAEKTQLFLLPEGAKKPELKNSAPPAYPRSYRMRRDPIKASFMLFVGADGHVKSLYCYDTNDQVFALATADAVIKWEYKPGRIGDTAVPMIIPLVFDYAEAATAVSRYLAPASPLERRSDMAERGTTPVSSGSSSGPR